MRNQIKGFPTLGYNAVGGEAGSHDDLLQKDGMYVKHLECTGKIRYTSILKKFFVKKK